MECCVHLFLPFIKLKLQHALSQLSLTPFPCSLIHLMTVTHFIIRKDDLNTFFLRRNKKEHRKEKRKLFSPSSNHQHLHKKRFYQNILSRLKSSLGKKPSKGRNSENLKEVYKKEISVNPCLFQLKRFQDFNALTVQYWRLNPPHFSLISSILPLIFHEKKYWKHFI